MVVLALAVMFFRTFAAEGYMISTGSMAPSLLGYHRQVECPSCGFHFARGVQLTEAELAQTHCWKSHAVAQSEDSATEADMVGDFPSATTISATVCPNCGRNGILSNTLPRNEGDQLMVDKGAFGNRDPHRWEVVVFRNPQDPEQAYVKRLVGLPNEKLEIWEGDVFANGEIQRKSLSSQLGTRIVVDDHDFTPPVADDWEPRWGFADNSGWTESPGRFRYQAGETEGDEPHWVNYRHWVRAGGEHHTAVALGAWPPSVAVPHPSFSSLQYDAERKQLTHIGAMSSADYDHWCKQTNDQALLDAVDDLYGESHIAPVTDDYGYNHPNSAAKQYPVRDLMLELTLTAPANSAGVFLMEMTDDGHRKFRTEIDFAAKQIRLTQGARVLRSAPLPLDIGHEPLRVIMSLFDRQVLVAINDNEVFTPWPIPTAPTGEVPRRALRIGAARGAVIVEHLGLYRDVYYTAKPGGAAQGVTLEGDEFFVLGDNSPVSIDSRCWDEPAIRRNDLIGKPFVVHLPSQQKTLPWSGGTRYVRVPDFSKIRAIR